MADTDDRRVLLGRIAGAHGIRGDVLIRSYTSPPEAIGSYGALSDETGKRSFSIASLRVTSKGVAAHLSGVSDRTTAEGLRGVSLFVARSRLPPAAEGEYYLADLIGMTARDAGGQTIGEIIDVPNYGAGDLLEIRPAAGGDTLLVPFTDACVPEVDLDRGQALVVLPQEAPEAGD
jgi:16S rRNA processing protein RimM